MIWLRLFHKKYIQKTELVRARSHITDIVFNPFTDFIGIPKSTCRGHFQNSGFFLYPEYKSNVNQKGRVIENKLQMRPLKIQDSFFVSRI